MSFFSRRKEHSEAPSTEAPASGLASSQLTQKQQFPINSQSQSQSPQEEQQSQPVYPWSAHAPPFGQSPSPFLRCSHALSTTATAAGELFLFGGKSQDRRRNDLYVISTRDFSTKLLQTSGDVPSPRCGHRAVLTSTILLIWGGETDSSNQKALNQNSDDSFYLLNLVSREWTRIVVNGPGPGARYYHTMKLVGSRLFVFGGRIAERRLNDTWALDLDRLESNPFWESYDFAHGNEKPLPRTGHVSVTTGGRIIIFGGRGDRRDFNDTWSFNVSTRKWTELQCTGPVPSPRAAHAAVLVGDIMYVFGGHTTDGTYLGDLIALNLLTLRWTAFQDIGPSPCRRGAHAMASDGRRVFVIGGALLPGAQADDPKPIHVLDTKLLIYPEPDSDVVNPGEETTQLVRKSSASHPTRGQPHQPSPSSSHAHAAHGAPRNAITEELDHSTSQSEQNPSLNGLSSRPTGSSGWPRRVLEEGDYSDGSTERHTMLVAPGAPSGKEIARLEDGRLIDLRRQLSGTLVAKTERDRRIAQLTDELALKSALLEQAAEEKKLAGLEQRKLQAKLDQLLLSRDQALEQAQSALQKATSRAANADSRSQPACEHETELAELRAELEGKKSELEEVRLRLMDAEDRCAMSKAEVDAYRNQAPTGPVNTDEDRVVHRLMERVRTMEAELASRRWNEKSIEEMECRNEG